MCCASPLPSFSLSPFFFLFFCFWEFDGRLRDGHRQHSPSRRCGNRYGQWRYCRKVGSQFFLPFFSFFSPPLLFFFLSLSWVSWRTETTPSSSIGDRLICEIRVLLGTSSSLSPPVPFSYSFLPLISFFPTPSMLLYSTPARSPERLAAVFQDRARGEHVRGGRQLMMLGGRPLFFFFFFSFLFFFFIFYFLFPPPSSFGNITGLLRVIERGV